VYFYHRDRTLTSMPDYLSIPRTSVDMGTLKTEQILSRVWTVMGRPASISCQ
jgi:hypothetical protein